MIEWETQGELDLALLRQMEREALLETVYDERRLSDAEIQTLLKERSVRALAEDSPHSGRGHAGRDLL